MSVMPQLDLIRWIRYINWVIVESPFRYAACLSVISLYLLQCERGLSWIIDSQTFDKDGKIDIGLKFDFKFFEPAFLKIRVTWAIFHLSGKYLISNILLSKLDNEYEISFEISCKNLPGIPHGDTGDFLRVLNSFPTSKGDVFKADKTGTFSILFRCGGSSSNPLTLDFDAKKLLNKYDPFP